jgi:hypothetical protein
MATWRPPGHSDAGVLPCHPTGIWVGCAGLRLAVDLDESVFAARWAESCEHIRTAFDREYRWERREERPADPTLVDISLMRAELRESQTVGG